MKIEQSGDRIYLKALKRNLYLRIIYPLGKIYQSESLERILQTIISIHEKEGVLKKLLIIQPDGTQEKKVIKEEPTLRQLQEWVGGLIDITSGVYKKMQVDVIVNDDGIGLGLKQNLRASIVCDKHIVGPAVICENFKLS